MATRRGKQFNTLIYDETDPLTGAPRDAVYTVEVAVIEGRGSFVLQAWGD